jgi:hypothetical protein
MGELTAVVAVIIGVSELVKRYIPTKYTPLISLLLGVIAGLYIVPGKTVAESLMTGITLGLSASGLYDMSKVVKKAQ